MIANYHTHTWRCMHAFGDEREYVEQAIRGGLKILGFSDHTPVPYKDGYVSNVKMTPDQLEDYVDTVLSLRDEYRKDIEIHLGLEVEYYPGYIDAMLEMMKPYPIEYFLLGQHFLGDEIGEPYCGERTYSSDSLLRYCRQTKEAMRTGLFTYFAHPDVLFYIGDKNIYTRNMRDLCETAKELSVPLEINLLGIETNRNYPNPLFWKIAGEVGNDVVIGSDAHFPENVVNEDALRAADRIIKENGLHLLKTVDLINPLERQ